MWTDHHDVHVDDELVLRRVARSCHAPAAVRVPEARARMPRPGRVPDWRMLMAEVVDAAAAVTATRSRLAKVELLAALLRRVDADEIAPTVGFLVGRARQGRVGVGWRGVSDVMGEPADVATLEIGDVDALFDRLLGVSGAGSAAARSGELRAVTSRATVTEQDFIGRVLLGRCAPGRSRGCSSTRSRRRRTLRERSCDGP